MQGAANFVIYLKEVKDKRRRVGGMSRCRNQLKKWSGELKVEKMNDLVKTVTEAQNLMKTRKALRSSGVTSE